MIKPSGTKREFRKREESLDLFAFFGIKLPSIGSREALPASKSLTRSESVVYPYFFASPSQFLFAFMLSECRRLVPKSLFVYLNYEVGDFFGYSRALFNMAMRLYDDRGIIYVGEFIALTKEQVAPYVRNDPELLRAIEDELDKVGLGLNSKVVGWLMPRRGSTRTRGQFPAPRGV